MTGPTPLPFGFLRVAAAAPELRVADPRFNVERTLDVLVELGRSGVDVAVFPEMGLTGYTCHDLFHDRTLLAAAADSLAWLAERAAGVFPGVAVVGLPVVSLGRLFNVAVAFQAGKMLAAVPKTFLPNYREFYDARYFAPAPEARADAVTVAGQAVPFGTDLLLEAVGFPEVIVGVEICEDLWLPIAPSARQALAGASVLLNLSASNETVGKAAYRRHLVASQSARCLAGYVYAGAGTGESTTDIVFGGHCLVAENGATLAESPRFRRDSHFVVADLDLERLARERGTTTGFGAADGHPASRPFRRVPFDLVPQARSPELARFVDARPFVPADPATLAERCEEIVQTQTAGLAKRLSHAGFPAVSIGVSGGLDSTLALVVLCKTLDLLGKPRSGVKALTMPGFGTSVRTKGNAEKLARALGVTLREVDIRPLCLEEMRALGHRPFGLTLEGATVGTLSRLLEKLSDEDRHDLVFENVQARMRTQLLMNSGFVLGTGDLSELALGWCTYNADHMSMYNPNVGVPKTLVRFLVGYLAQHEFAGAGEVLRDIAATPISPELLPASELGASQSTEDAIGPYELHDFFLYQFLRFGTPPAKIVFLTRHAKFTREHPEAEVRRWLGVFLRRFFANQFKRSCLPDGPKVGSVSVSPRGDWRMPSDASTAAWLAALGASP